MTAEVLHSERLLKRIAKLAVKAEAVSVVVRLWAIQKLDVIEHSSLALVCRGWGAELLALRWCDVDFENLELRVTRSIWHQVLGNCKSEASAKPVPMDRYMAEDLLR